jgi:hypothetical protein
LPQHGEGTEPVKHTEVGAWTQSQREPCTVPGTVVCARLSGVAAERRVGMLDVRKPSKETAARDSMLCDIGNRGSMLYTLRVCLCCMLHGDGHTLAGRVVGCDRRPVSKGARVTRAALRGTALYRILLLWRRAAEAHDRETSSPRFQTSRRCSRVSRDPPQT